MNAKREKKNVFEWITSEFYFIDFLKHFEGNAMHRIILFRVWLLYLRTSIEYALASSLSALATAKTAMQDDKLYCTRVEEKPKKKRFTFYCSRVYFILQCDSFVQWRCIANVHSTTCAVCACYSYSRASRQKKKRQQVSVTWITPLHYIFIPPFSPLSILFFF